ncbi:MAG: hypothetical protein AAF333_16640 [Planctomycetota bacterium]
MAPDRAVIPPGRLELVYSDGPPPWDAAPDCAAVCVGGRYTRQAVRAYADTGIQIVALVDWPAGIGKPTVRQIEAVAAAKDGAHAVEVPAPPEYLRTGDLAALRDDLEGIVSAVREVSRAVNVRVRLNMPVLFNDREELGRTCRVVCEAGGDAVVLSAVDREETASLGDVEFDKPPSVIVFGEARDVGRFLAAGAKRVAVASGIASR